MNKSILIFTDRYPFSKSEPFLETELQYIVTAFKRVTLLPFEKGKDKNMREVSENTEVLKPVFNEVKNRSELLAKGIFNKSVFFRLVNEGFRSGIWKSWIKFRIWATHFLVIRSILRGTGKRDLTTLFNQFDVLYFYWGLRWSQIIPFLPSDLQPKIVVRFHGSDLYEYTNNYYIPWRNEQLSRISKAAVISETGRKYIEDQYKFPHNKVIVSRIGTNDFGINPFVKSETITIVSCSNIVPVKRVDLIVRTLSFLKTPALWIHFGGGPQMKEIKKLVKSLPGHIIADMRGPVGHNEIMDFFRSVSVDLFINVSSSEGVPVSAMEAMSFGIPVIATNAGGTAEIVSEKTGMLIDIGFSPEELAENIEAYIKRDDLIDIRNASRKEWEKKSMAENVYPEFVEELSGL